MALRKGLSPSANRPTFAGESRRKCPRNRSGSLGRWVFGEPRVVLRRAIVAGSQVVGRGGSGRRGFGCWLARVSAGARQPENDKRVSVVFATCRSRGPLRKGRCFAHRVHRLSRSRPARGERTSFGKGSDRRRRKSSCGSLGETPDPRVDRRSRSVQVSRGWLASGELAGLLPAPQGVAQARVAPVTAPPGKGCHWPAECVTVWFVHAC